MRPSILVLPLSACALLLVPPAAPAAKDAPTSLEKLELRIGKGLTQLSPPADPADAWARDEAARKLSHFDALASTLGDVVLWGGYDAKKGYDPKGYTLTEFYAPTWVKLYLSTFMFSGTPVLAHEGDLDVVEVPAKFRGNLEPGDYPYPFWHSAEKWRAYKNTDAVVLVFRGEKIVAAYRKVGDAPSSDGPERPWDGQWKWTAADGSQQPRVALFTYLFSPENPKVAPLEAAYRSLEETFRGQNCTSCHAPDNKSKMKPLLLLNYPNQALAARHALVETLGYNLMPPEDKEKGTHEGIADPQVRQGLIDRAKAFEKAADDALAFEQERGALRVGAAR
jgi:mono/diheme cytochrome c family protein